MKFTIIGAPTSAGSHNAGQEDAPAALRAAGLVDQLRAAGMDVEDAGDLPRSPYRPQGIGVPARDLDRVAGVLTRLAGQVAGIARTGRVPIVLGGDCTITLGAVAGLQAAAPDRLGLLYFDGDIDLSRPDEPSSGVLDSMVVSHLLGRGAGALTHLGPRTPALDETELALFGYHPVEASAEHREWLHHSRVSHRPVTEIREDAPGAAAGLVRELAERVDRILVHVDVDVIDSGDFPLGNFPHFNGGLTADEAFACLAEFTAVDALAGLVVTEVNPHHDPDGTMVARLSAAIAGALARRAAVAASS